MAEPVSHRRRRGFWLPLVVILLVLVAIAVVVDRVAAKAASNELKSQIGAELVSRDVTYESLDVEVGGMPFLTQVAEGRYDANHDRHDRGPAAAGSDRAATLPELHVVASGVNADTSELIEGTAPVVADEVSGTAVVSYDTLTGLLDLSAYQLSEVTFDDEDGALKASGDRERGRAQLPIQALADVSAVNGEIQVRLQDARAVGVRCQRRRRGSSTTWSPTHWSRSCPRCRSGSPWTSCPSPPRGWQSRRPAATCPW